MTSSRRYFSYIAFLCAVALLSAYSLEFIFGQKPCDLCLLQRFAVYFVGFVALLASAHAPQRKGIKIYAMLCLLGSLGGLATSGRQVYLQSLPEELKPSCGPGLLYRLDHSPWLDAFTQAMHGTGDCAQIGWTFLGLSLAVWTGFLFILLAMMSLGALKLKKVVR